jgi:quercetin dioxygenase-like cupin family protein
MEHVAINDLASRELAPGVVLRSVYLEGVMVTFVQFEQGAQVPLHSHPHEQISVMISGSLLFTVGGEERTVKAGEVVLVPSGAEHGAKAADGPALAYDSWSPIREDYILDK